MDRENARHETALDMVKGKPRCEKILEQAAAKIKIPNRTQEEERQVEGKVGGREGGGSERRMEKGNTERGGVRRICDIRILRYTSAALKSWCSNITC